MLDFRKLLFWSLGLYLHEILHLLYKFHTNRPKWCRNIEEQNSIWRPDRHIEIAQFQFLSNDHARNRNSLLFTKFDRNWMIRGWDMKIKLFSKWRPSAVLHSRKLLLWSRDLCLYVILHLLSKFHVNRSKWHRRISEKLFSIWHPTAILNFRKLPISSRIL